MSDGWSDRLSEYLDGELPPDAARDLELHLRDCAACRQSLAELKAVVARLTADPVSPADQPTDREWQAIRRAMPAPRRRWMIPTAIAAGLAGLAIAGALLRSREPLRVATATVPAVYLQATEELEAVLRDNRTQLRPETVQALEASLVAIDSALAQADRALAADPANDYVTRSMGRLRDARLTVLRQAVAVATSKEL
ncbi:MAG TPA: zf-HC2 domain-containing protein [Gemmatimonadales bacterium]|nr:zf-HC2 domain-containing protein [Gemmatimonadales bacterium]